MRASLASAFLFTVAATSAQAQGIAWGQYKPVLATCVKHYLCETSSCQRTWRCNDDLLTPIDREYLTTQGQSLRGTSRSAADIANGLIRDEIGEIGDASVGAQVGGPRDLSLGEVDPDAPRGSLGEIDPRPNYDGLGGAAQLGAIDGFGATDGPLPQLGGFTPQVIGGIGPAAGPAFGPPMGRPYGDTVRSDTSIRSRRVPDPYDRPTTYGSSAPTTGQKVRVSVDNGNWKEIDLARKGHAVRDAN